MKTNSRSTARTFFAATVISLSVMVGSANAMGPAVIPPPPPPPPPPAVPCDCSTIPTLLSASEFAAVAVSDLLHLQGSAFATGGNIGVGPGGSVWLQGAAGIDGYVKHHTGTVVTGGAAAVGGVFELDMTGPIADLFAASAAFAAMPPTQMFGSLTGATTITGNGCINVIDIAGNIDISGGSEIRLQGTSEDYFIINISGDMETQGTADVILDGMDPQNVIYNFTTPGMDVQLGGNSGGNGTFLNLQGEIYLHGNSGGTGAYYAGGGDLHFQGNADFYGRPFACANAACADPESSGINIQTPSTPPSRGTGNRPFFYAYADPLTYEGHLEAFRVAPDGSIKDSAGVDAVDPVTTELAVGRVPYWDAGTQLKTNLSRNLYTAKAGARIDFNTTNVSEADMNLLAGELTAYPNYPASGVTTTAQLRDAIVGYLNGEDAFDEDLDLSNTDLRAFVLGDIFRSNPVIISEPVSLVSHETGYDGFRTAYETRDHVVYAGANDGLFHGFDAGAYYDPNDATLFNSGTGDELFGFVPGLLLDQIKLTPRTDDLTGERLAPGFVDGNIIAADSWLGDGSGTDITKSSDEWATVMITAFREGGRGYLATDITEPGAIAGAHGPYPKFLWEFTDADLGQSWSRPVITRVKLAGPVGMGDNCGADDGDGDCREEWVAVFGGGYELDSDPNDLTNFIDDPTSLAWRDRTKAIYMVSLESGAVLASVRFDSTGLTGPAEMKYGFPSAPAAIDLNSDAFTDVIYIGDNGGQLWKWDVSTLGVDSGGDAEIDNWTAGIFFTTPKVVVTGGRDHYRSFYNPPAAAYYNKTLTLTFGSGERNDVLYEGDPLTDDNNRYWVVYDSAPTGAGAFPGALTEASLTDVTSTAQYVPPVGGNKGYYFTGVEGEKFITDSVIFAGYTIFGSYIPPTSPVCGPGEAHFYIFDLGDASGFFDADLILTEADRKVQIGWGIPSNPRVSVASSPSNDRIYVNTSDGQVLTIVPPTRSVPESSTLYWRQKF